MIGHRSRFRGNGDLPLRRGPVVKKKPPLSNVRAQPRPQGSLLLCAGNIGTPWPGPTTWLCKHNRLRPEPIRFVRLDSEHAQSDGKYVIRGLPELDLARGSQRSNEWACAWFKHFRSRDVVLDQYSSIWTLCMRNKLRRFVDKNLLGIFLCVDESLPQ